MPIFIFNPETKIFSIMILSSLIYPIDDRTLIVRDNVCVEYKLVFDSHEHLQETMIKLYKQQITYVYCDWYIEQQSQNYNSSDREIDPYKELDIDLEL